MHKWAKPSAPWRPTAVLSTDGVVIADPLQILAAERKKWQEMCHAEEAAPSEIAPSPTDQLPALTAAELRQAARAFPESTTSTVDVFHLRHLAILSDQGLEVLAVILQAVERTGRVPPQLRFNLVALFPKPTGGFWPIGIFPAVYRLLGKARRSVCAQWESQHDRPYFAARSGRAPVDTV